MGTDNMTAQNANSGLPGTEKDCKNNVFSTSFSDQLSVVCYDVILMIPWFCLLRLICNCLIPLDHRLDYSTECTDGYQYCCT